MCAYSEHDVGNGSDDAKSMRRVVFDEEYEDGLLGHSSTMSFSLSSSSAVVVVQERGVGALHRSLKLNVGSRALVKESGWSLNLLANGRWLANTKHG